jgi:hypothetical protein
MRVMSKPRSEIDESTLRTLLRHTARDIAHSRKPMLRLARGGFNGLLMSASVVVGLGGLFWLLGAIFSMANGEVDGFPLGFGGVVCGLTLFAVSVGLMRLARGPDRAWGQASKGGVQVGRRTLSTIVLVVSIVVIYAGASGLIFALLSLFTHYSDPQGVSQVAWGIPELAIGLAGIQASRYLRRR